MDAAALSRAAAVAAEMPGQAFDGGANANYPGFPFAQYVYARVGVGLTGPGRILEEAVHQPFDAAGATGGEIVKMCIRDRHCAGAHVVSLKAHHFVGGQHAFVGDLYVGEPVDVVARARLPDVYKRQK